MSSRRPGRSLLRIQRLEDRATPAVWNNPWPDPENLTVSFAPDGAQMGTVGSSLFANLSGLPEGVWQSEVLRAFQSWTAVTNVSVSVVADAGRPFGEAGPIQGSPHYGDIRIGAKPLTASELAVATPFDLIGAGAGDIVFNSQATFNQGGLAGGHDLYTVALQETGHALGLGNSTDPSSVMFTRYQGPRAGLSAADVAAVQRLYGVRTPDRFEVGGNNSLSDFQKLTYVKTGQALGTSPTSGSEPFVAAGDLTRVGDVDVYQVKTARGISGFYAELRTSGVSLLNARVSVYNKDKVLVKSVAATDPRTGDLSVYVPNARSESEYYVKVEAAGSKFAIGRYHLAVGNDAYRAVYPPVSTGLLNPDNHTNDVRSSADEMDYISFDALDSSGSGSGGGSGSGMMAPVDARWDFLERASIEDATDKDWYKVNSAFNTSGVLVAVVSATEAGKLDPVIRAYDVNGVPLPVDVLSNDASTYSVQVRGVTGNKTYYLEVVAAGQTAPADVGSYVLSADFRSKSVDFTTLFAGTLTQTASQEARRLDVTSTRVYHLSLTAKDTATAASVRTTIYDQNNQPVATFVARDGETVATDVVLGPGTYTIKVSAATQDGQPLPALGYTLKGFVRNDPIGPRAIDPTAMPTDPNPAPPAVYTFDFMSWVYWVDDYSDPWSGV